MGRFHVLTKISGLVLVGLIAVACSDVAFTPAPINESLELPDGTRTDTYFFNGEKPLTKVDVLFIIDNSGSIAEEQQKLADRLSSFVDTLEDVDWQIGITTTDVSGGAQSTNGNLAVMAGTSSRILNKRVPNYEQVFLNTVKANGTSDDCVINQTGCGSGDEQPLKAINMSIQQRNNENLGFFRGGADFVSIVLSDEDERSTGGAGATTGEQVVDTVRLAWGGTKFHTNYGLIIRPTDTACFDKQRPTGGHYGTFVQHLTELTNGETGSICDDDYGPALDSIGKRVKRFATTITLSAMPDAATVEVVLTPANPLITWAVVGQTIRLSDLPAKGTRVSITYKILE